jgi:signal transduction histidine kinase
MNYANHVKMRNPLSAILQSADNIASTIEEAEKKGPAGPNVELERASADSITDSASTIVACASHQKRIVDDILNLSKLDASLLVVTPDEVDPIATVQHALQLHQHELKSAGVEGCVRIDSSFHDLRVKRVFLDPSRLLQVLINLLTNAIKLYAAPCFPTIDSSS